jgi:hypothetical protein
MPPPARAQRPTPWPGCPAQGDWCSRWMVGSLLLSGSVLLAARRRQRAGKTPVNSRLADAKNSTVEGIQLCLEGGPSDSCRGTISEREENVPDGLDLSMVTQSALPAAFTFIFEQVDSLLTRWRERRDARAGLTAEHIPPELMGTLSLPLETDLTRLTARAAELEAYRLALARYREDPSLITTSDTALLAMLGHARGALEEIHRQRFTFVGESRPRSGPSVSGRYKEVAGDLVGMEATQAIRGDAAVDLDVDVVHPGGKVVGMSAPIIEDSA